MPFAWVPGTQDPNPNQSLFTSLFYDRILYRASSTTRQLAPRLLAPTRPRTTHMPPGSSAGCPSHGFLEHRSRNRNNYLSRFYSMTAPSTERLHRRVNWPPGCWRPPDRGRPICLRTHTPYAFRMVFWNTEPKPETFTFKKSTL